MERIIDRALQRDFQLEATKDKPLYVLTMTNQETGTILCQIEDCAKRTHKISLTKTNKRPWNSQNFYRHVRAVHFKSKKLKPNTEESVDSPSDHENQDENNEHTSITLSDEESDSSKSKNDS